MDYVKKAPYIGDRPQPLDAYSVLACLSSDVNTPETFADFCGDYGYNEDSISARQAFERCYTFAKKLRTFFTSEEISELQEIQ